MGEAGNRLLLTATRLLDAVRATIRAYGEAPAATEGDAISRPQLLTFVRRGLLLTFVRRGLASASEPENVLSAQ